MTVINRRALLASAAAGTAAAVSTSRTVNAQVMAQMMAQAPAQAPAQAAGPFRQPPLPFLEAQLAPTISNRTVTLHYARHHAAYFTALNSLTKDTKYAAMSLEQVCVESDKEVDRRIYNNATQAWNHNIYWEQFKPGGAKAPTGKLLDMINASFGSFDQMKIRLKAEAVAVFGSGWGWLAQEGDRLVVVGTQGGANLLTQPAMTTLLGIDVWEHAYYLDYENRRADHIQAVLDNIINWDVVASRLKT
jgi:Fe-Mn family superoxide dismutase